jgi:hypothetical protein
VVYPTARTPAAPNDDIENDACANPHCGRPVGLAGVFVAGKGRICGKCFRETRYSIAFDENMEMQRTWQK